VNPFAQLETACATAVERAFALAFPSALEPVHVARKLVAAFESGSVPSGRAGRRFIVRMNASDFARLGGDMPYLERQWGAMVARLAERSGRPQRAPEVVAEASDGVAPGTVAIAIEVLPEPPNLTLRVRRGLPPGARLSLALADGAAVLVGRDPSCDFVLTDPRASRRHLEIARDGVRLRFRDLGSSNGTRLNGALVTDGEIGLGDVFRVGDTELAIEPGETEPGEPEPREAHSR
jgi:hypothetical protein